MSLYDLPVDVLVKMLETIAQITREEVEDKYCTNSLPPHHECANCRKYYLIGHDNFLIIPYFGLVCKQCGNDPNFQNGVQRHSTTYY